MKPMKPLIVDTIQITWMKRQMPPHQVLIPVVMTNVTPLATPPLTMKPLVLGDGNSGHVTIRDHNNAPVWVGYHPDYQAGERHFSCQFQVDDLVYFQEPWAVRVLQAGYWLEWEDGDNAPVPSDKEKTAPIFVREPDDFLPANTMPAWASRFIMHVRSVACEQRDGVWVWVVTGD